MSLSDVRGHTACGLTLALVCALLLSCCQRAGEETNLRRLKRPMMGSLVEIVWQGQGQEGEADRVRSVMGLMDVLAARMNLHNPESELAAVNAAAGLHAVNVSDDFLAVIEQALDVSRFTKGLFDITVGPLETVWGNIQWVGGGHLARRQEILEALSRVGYQRIRTDPTERTVYLEEKGIRIDLGGIAKGYVVDRAIAWLRQRSIRTVLVNAGGDIGVSWNAGADPWRVGLQDPFQKKHLLGVFEMHNGAVVTSGTYERYYETPEGSYSHILDPLSGLPLKAGSSGNSSGTGTLCSATVVAEQAALADAMATALMVAGREEAVALVRRHGSLKAVLIESDGTIWVHEGLRGMLTFDPLPSGTRLRFYPEHAGGVSGTRKK